MRSLEASFAPAYNGDTLTTEIWRTDPDPVHSTIQTIFRVVNQEGVSVLDRGRASFSKAIST
jgi:acyl dehydratase